MDRNMIVIKQKKTAILIFLWLFLTSSVFAKDKAIIVFDASGSMWSKIDGKTKITVAKDTLKNIVNNWDEKKALGLLAYGHRKKGDCNDIQTLVPVGKVDKKVMISMVEKINPKGKTPISAAIKMAADELKFTEDNATIILISDGKETCNADPCTTAAELEKLGVNFTTHVIGFDVDEETGKQLQCIATETGGKYFPAVNAKELNDALKKVTKQLSKKLEKEALIVNSIFNVETTVETIHKIDGVSDIKKDSAKYQLKTNYNRGSEEVTLTLTPKIEKYSKGIETLAKNVPGSWRRTYTTNGKLKDFTKSHGAIFFNWKTQNIFSIGYLMLPVNDVDDQLQQKWLINSFFASLPILEDIEITNTSLTDTEIGVNFRSIPTLEPSEIAFTISGSGVYDRKSLLLKKADVRESLTLKNKVKRNGNEVVIEKIQQLHFVIEGEQL